MKIYTNQGYVEKRALAHYGQWSVVRMTKEEPFSVTHRPTGLAVLRNIPSMDHAKRMAFQLDKSVPPSPPFNPETDSSKSFLNWVENKVAPLLPKEFI